MTLSISRCNDKITPDRMAVVLGLATISLVMATFLHDVGKLPTVAYNAAFLIYMVFAVALLAIGLLWRES